MNESSTVIRQARFPKNLHEGLWRGIFFVAHNDDAACVKTREIESYLSVVALSEAFGYSARFIAIKVKQVRLGLVK